MAELATIARPYAEALFKAVGADWQTSDQVQSLARVAADAGLLQFEGNPKVTAAAVYDVVTSVAKTDLSPKTQNFLRTVLENGRLSALPEIAAQFHTLVAASSGVSDAQVFSALALEGPALADVKLALEKRFGRKLNPSVTVAPELIGGIRVVVGDEVLDSSVKARLEQMKAALTA